MKGSRVLVVKPDVVVDGFDQVANTAECAAADSFPSDFGEPAFDLVEPGRTGWCEVGVIARSCCQPLLHFGMLVGSVVIEDQNGFPSQPQLTGRSGRETAGTPDAGAATGIHQ